MTRITMWLLDGSMRHPRRVLVIAGLATLVAAALFVRVEIDTDPENMLASQEPVRVRNAAIAERFGTGEMIVVGLLSHGSLATVEHLTAALDLHRDLAAVPGVIADKIVSVELATDDTALGSSDDVAALLDRVDANALLADNVISADRDALAFFVPLADKSDALPVRDAALDLVAESPALAALDARVAGLPLAQEAFGDQMFVQMALFAPLAGIAIFALMMLFFRRIVLVAPAMLLALLTVVWTMGLLIGTGNTVHIMASMIPIFLMPIAILDGVHVISEFFEASKAQPDRRLALRSVVEELASPIAFTTITTFVGFGALALTPIPPVQVFGIFVALGVVLAWLATLTVLPAVLSLVRAESLERAVGHRSGDGGRFARVVRSLPVGAARRSRSVVGAVVALVVLSGIFVTQVQVNDNPVNWFRADHEVRTATDALNEELPGTFGANLILEAGDGTALTEATTIAVVRSLQGAWDGEPIIGTAASYVDVVGDTTGAEARTLLAEARADSPLVATLITEDGSAANLRLQLRNGDNQAMQQVVDLTRDQLDATPLPAGVTAEWGGETYLNLVWQDKMVSGMLVGFGVTLAVVLALLTGLFRSLRWALIAIMPVLVTVLAVYGTIGLIGKDFDMPIAVLSTLVLGIGVDFAIHFVQRYRQLTREGRDVDAAIAAFGEEPARALTRNAAVIAIGFAPLLFSSLVPYVIVGLFLAGIMVTSWLLTVTALPALVATLRERLPEDA